MEQAAIIQVTSREDVERMIRSHAEKIRSFGIEGISLFGSFNRNTEITNKSDVDFLIEFAPGCETYNNFADLNFYLEDLLGREVDLLSRSSLRSDAGRQIAESSARIQI